MSVAAFKKRLTQYIAEGKTEDAITALHKRLREDAYCYSDLFLLQGRFNKIKKANNEGVIDRKEYDTTSNQIDKALLDLIAALTETDLTDDTFLFQAELRALSLPALPLLALVNCDRKTAYNGFENAFGQQGERPGQFYFLAGCPMQKPDSFAERMVYEIISEVLDNNTQAILYETVEEKIGARTVQRLDIHPLPYNKLGNAEACQRRFQEWIEQAFGHFRHLLPTELADLSIEALAALPPNQLPVHYFTFAFRIDLDELSIGPKLLDYLRWIVNTFRQRPHKPPAFQFIFVVAASDLHKKPHEGVDALRQFVEQLNLDANNGPAACTWLEAFDTVPVADVEAWLRTKKNNPDIPKIKKVVQQFTDGLQRNERWDGYGGMDMADVEEFVKMVYGVSHEP
jgi:Effector-associated domain 11